MMNVLGVIPARGGSKGISNKNLALLGGRPLLAYTADAVKESKLLTRTIVSTDDARIADCARSLGLDVPFMRPSALAGDDVPMLPVVQHAVAALEADGFAADAVVLLQPTSPLRRGEHIDAAVNWLEYSGNRPVRAMPIRRSVVHTCRPVGLCTGWKPAAMPMPSRRTPATTSAA